MLYLIAFMLLVQLVMFVFICLFLVKMDRKFNFMSWDEPALPPDNPGLVDVPPAIPYNDAQPK